MNNEDKLLDPEIRHQLDLLRNTPPRDPESASSGRRNFLKTAESMAIPISTDTRGRIIKWIPLINIKERRSIFTAITTIIVVLTVLFGGTGATVYAAQDSLPNDILYPVKIWSEDVRLDLNNNPENEFDLIESFILRRFEEVDALLEEDEPIPPELVIRLEKHLRYMLQLAAQMKNEDLEKALIRVRSMLQEREKLMTKQGKNVPEWANPEFSQMQQMLTERLRKIETGIDDPLNFKKQMDSPAGSYGPGPGTDSGNPDDIAPIPPEQGEDEPSDSGMCEPVQEECVTQPERENNSPTDPPMNSDPQGPQGTNGSQNDNNKPGNGGGKP